MYVGYGSLDSKKAMPGKIRGVETVPFAVVCLVPFSWMHLLLAHPIPLGSKLEGFALGFVPFLCLFVWNPFHQAGRQRKERHPCSSSSCFLPKQS